MGGVPAQLVPDNPKVGVVRANRYEPGLNRTYLELATHYRTAILPTCPRKPSDKEPVCTIAPPRPESFMAFAAACAAKNLP
jgi:hypothetical protein